MLRKNTTHRTFRLTQETWDQLTDLARHSDRLTRTAAVERAVREAWERSNGTPKEGKGMKAVRKVTDEGFDLNLIHDKPISALPLLDWGTSYPIAEDRDGVLTCVGVVDGNYPELFNGGRWHVVNDDYAVACHDPDCLDCRE